MAEDLVPVSVPVEVKNIAVAIAEGRVKNAKMEWQADGSVTFSANSPDGKSRIIMQKREFSGVVEESKISISKPANKEERLERVAELRQRGWSQTKVSEVTMTSQKTVSNDEQELIRRGVLQPKR